MLAIFLAIFILIKIDKWCKLDVITVASVNKVIGMQFSTYKTQYFLINSR